MVDPVVAADGFTYERDAIVQWLKGRDTSPRTGQPLDHKILIPNHDKRQQVVAWCEQNGVPMPVIPQPAANPPAAGGGAAVAATPLLQKPVVMCPSHSNEKVRVICLDCDLEQLCADIQADGDAKVRVFRQGVAAEVLQLQQQVRSAAAACSAANGAVLLKREELEEPVAGTDASAVTGSAAAAVVATALHSAAEFRAAAAPAAAVGQVIVTAASVDAEDEAVKAAAAAAAAEAAAALEVVLARFHESDECRSASIWIIAKVYKQLSDKYQIVKDFVKVFPGGIVEVALSDPQIPRTTTTDALHDVQLHFQNVASYFYTEHQKVLQVLEDDAIICQFSRQIECYGNLMVYHNNLRIWQANFNFHDVASVHPVYHLKRITDDLGKFVAKICQGIQQKAIDVAHFYDFERPKNLTDVCSIFRFLQCMASNLPIEIGEDWGITSSVSAGWTHHSDAIRMIDRWFERILDSNQGHFRMKKIGKHGCILTNR
jgi:hypothetical protein